MSEEHFLSTTPVHVTLQSLQRQVDQLKRIINKPDLDEGAKEGEDEKELKKEIENLRTVNTKAEYRIQMLLRTLQEKDELIKKLTVN